MVEGRALLMSSCKLFLPCLRHPSITFSQPHLLLDKHFEENWCQKWPLHLSECGAVMGDGLLC